MLNSTGEGVCHTTNVHSWYDFVSICPQDPRTLVAHATLEGNSGQFYNSGTFGDQAWANSPLLISTKPVVYALGSDNGQKVAEASQWNFSHLTWNDSASLAAPLRKVVFLRGGREWFNAINFDFGHTPIQEVQISFLSNAATRGDKQGTIPVFRWTDGSWAGVIPITLVLQKYGLFTLGIWTYDGTNYAMYELVVISVS